MARQAFKQMVLSLRPNAAVIPGTPKNGGTWIGSQRYAIADFAPEWAQVTDCHTTAMNAWREYWRILNRK